MKNKKYIVITESEFRKLDLTYEESEKTMLEGGHIYIPVEKRINDMLDKNKKFWLENGFDNIMLLTHAKLSERRKKVLPKSVQFIYESFLDKYYCKTHCTILFYPDLMEYSKKKNVYTFICDEEYIEVPTDEVETIYKIILNK